MSGVLKEKIRSVVSIGILLIVVASLTHLYSPIDFYARSYSSLILEIGIAVSLFSAIYYIVDVGKNALAEKILDFFTPFGTLTLVSYFGHFILIYKPLQLITAYTGIQLLSSISPAISAAMSLVLVLFFRDMTVKFTDRGLMKYKKSKIFRNALIAITAILLITLINHLISIRNTRPTYILMTVDVERDLVPYLDSYDGITEGLPIILEIFRDRGIKATFFVTGNVAELYPETIQKIADEGHEVGGQGYMHERLNELNSDEKYDDINKTTTILKKFGVVAFRSPYQSVDIEVVDILEEFGYCAEASYDSGKGTYILEGKSMVRVSSDPLFYPSETYPASWTDVYDQAFDIASEHENRIIVVGLHSWEVLEMPHVDVEDAERYVIPSGDYTYTNLVGLLNYLEQRTASGENIKFITVKEACEIFLPS